MDWLLNGFLRDLLFGKPSFYLRHSTTQQQLQQPLQQTTRKTTEATREAGEALEKLETT